MNTVFYWYDGLKFPGEVIEYLVEYCITNGHSSLRYMDKVAIGWAENGINSIEIPSELISIAGKQDDVEVTIDVSEYIPEGVTLVDPEESTVEITVSIGKIKEKVFRVQTENIIVTGLSTQNKLEFELSSVAVHVSGLEEDILKLSSGTIHGSIDVTHLPVGTHEVELMLDLDESKYTYLPIKVTVYITDVADPEINPPAENGGEDDNSGV